MNRQKYYSEISTPIGELLLVATDDGLAEVRVRDAGTPAVAEQDLLRDDGLLEEARQQFKAYFAGVLFAFDVPLAIVGTPFQRKVWNGLCAIPYGETLSYGQLAKRLGQPTAARAVGTANGCNRLPIIVPCHRVIGANGALGGFGLGLHRKKWLLDHEAAAGAAKRKLHTSSFST